jgi:PAS domain S-box-containing protein
MAELPSAAAWAGFLAAPDAAVVVTDASGVVVRWGESASRLYGYTPDEARGRDVISLLGVPEERPVARESTARAANGEVVAARRLVRVRSGEVLPVVGCAVRVADEDGDARLVGLVVPIDGRPGPEGDLDEVSADRLRLVGEARAAQLAAEEYRVGLDRLREVAARVAAAPRLGDVASVAATAAVEATGAAGGGVWLARRDEGSADRLAAVGLNSTATDATRRLLVDQRVPVTTAIATGEPIWVSTPDERHERFPALEALGITHAAIAAVPLVADDVVLGALAVYFAERRTFRREDRALVTGIAAVTASAVARTLALEASEAASALLGTAMSSAPVGFAFFDRDLRFVRVNSRLVEINGVSEEEHLGRTIDEVIPGLAPVVVPALRQVVESGEPVLGVELTGTTAAYGGEERIWVDDFYPVLGEGGDVLGVGAVVRDVTDARAASARLALMAEATAVLTASLDTREVLARLAGLVVDHVADLSTVLVPEEGMLRRVVARHRDPAVDLGPLLGLDPVPIEGSSEASVAYRTGRPVIADGPGRWIDALPDSDVADAVRALGLRSAVAVPLATPRVTFGVLSMASTGRVLGPDDVALAVDLTTRAAVAFENAARYEREHVVAEALQRAVLPERLPTVPGLTVAGCYEPATEAAAVGGDWYDVVPLSRGRVALVVGDIGGHGLRAAAAMGQLRNAVHAWLLAGLAPEEALALGEPLLGPETFATVAITVVDPATGELTAATAGHPPPVLVTGGRATLLEAGSNPPVGAGATSFATLHAVLPPGGLLVLYTDGLVEVKGEDLGDGLDRLTEALAGLDHEEPDMMCQKLLRDVRRAGSDDVCVLVTRRDATA